MPMIPFFSRFPEVGTRETRTIHVWKHEKLPAGEYGFLEFYCDEPDCDCRRVLIQVMSPTSGRNVWATINYGWESESYYRKWSHAEDEDEDFKRPMLDPINPQSRYSHVFLELFQEIIKDKEYVERLKRHYKMFRKTVVK